jgi:hypothetical protein
MKLPGQRLSETTNLWLVGAGVLAMAAMIALIPAFAMALLLSAFPGTFGPGFWSNVWLLLSACLWLPVCVGLALRLFFGRLPDLVDRRPNPMLGDRAAAHGVPAPLGDPAE